MPDTFIPPEDPPVVATPHSTMMYKAPTSETLAATKLAPAAEVVKPVAPLPLQGVAPLKSSIIEPPGFGKLAAAPTAPAPTMESSTPPSQVMTSGTSEHSSKFNLFISVFTGIVVLIWIGVGLLYYSNTQLEKEVTATPTSAPTSL